MLNWLVKSSNEFLELILVGMRGISRDISYLRTHGYIFIHNSHFACAINEHSAKAADAGISDKDNGRVAVLQISHEVVSNPAALAVGISCHDDFGTIHVIDRARFFS